MNLFTYLLAKNDKFSLVHKGDLFSYLLGKNNSIPLKTAEGDFITIEALKTKINELKMTKESTQDGTPTPENPIEVKTVKGYRNLLDLTNAQSQESNGVKITVNSDKSITLYGTSTRAITYDVAISDINLSSSKTYLISQSNSYYGSRYAISLRESSYGIVDNSCSLDSGKSNKEFTVSTDKVAKYFRLYIPNNVALDTTIYPMILEGTTIKPYVPYGNNYVYTAVSNGTNTNYYTIPLNGNEIAGIGDYKDELIVDKNGKCWLNKKTKKYTFNGSENESWGLTGTQPSDTNLKSMSNNTSITDRISGEIPAYSNYFGLIGYLGSASVITNATTTGLILNKSSNQIVIITTLSTAEAFKEWLSTHNISVYYVLATEDLIDLNYTVDIRLFNGVNNISNSDDMYMTLKYY